MIQPIATMRKKITTSDIRLRAENVLQIEAAAILDIIKKLDDRFDSAIELIASTSGHIVTTGVGKSGIIARKLAATFASTGTASFFLHPTEAIHGDFGRVTKEDIILAISYSGETEEILRLIPLMKRISTKLISIVGNCSSTLANASCVALDASISEEACPLGLAPTSSTIAAMALGDAIAMALLEYKGFQSEDFAALHPAGQLGRQLLKVENLMHSGVRIPSVSPTTPMSEAIIEMSRKGFGITTVIDEKNVLLGVISDGDLRRLMEKNSQNALSLPAREVMHIYHVRNVRPCTITRNELATNALKLMESHRITSLVVVNENNSVEGIIHFHDLWKIYN